MIRFPLRRALFALFGLLGLHAAAADTGSCLWYGDGRTLINPNGSAVKDRGGAEIAATADCGLWVLRGNRLQRYQPDGSEGPGIQLDGDDAPPFINPTPMTSFFLHITHTHYTTRKIISL